MTSPSQPPLPEPSGTPGRAPTSLVVAASLVGVEAVVLVVFGIAEIASVTGSRAVMGVTTAMFFALYGVGLAACAWMLLRLRPWARSPVVLAQLIQLGVAWSFRGGTSTAASAALTLVAVVVLVGVFTPASLRAVGERENPDADG